MLNGTDFRIGISVSNMVNYLPLFHAIMNCPLSTSRNDITAGKSLKYAAKCTSES